MKYCAHGYLTPPDLTSLLSRNVAEVGVLPSRSCLVGRNPRFILNSEAKVG